MLCNKCGHPKIEHANGERCAYPGCPCRLFVPPGDADSYREHAGCVELPTHGEPNPKMVKMLKDIAEARPTFKEDNR